MTASTATRVFPVACIVLAAGEGTRFGGPKAEAVLSSGKRFLDVVVRQAAEAGCDPVIAVVRPGTSVPSPARAVEARRSDPEPISSVRLGLAALANQGVEGTLLWPVDHPFVELASVLAVLDAARRTRAPVVVPTFEGRRGHPTFFHRDTFLALMTVRDGGARAAVRDYGESVIEVEVGSAGVLRGINTPEELADE